VQEEGEARRQNTRVLNEKALPIFTRLSRTNKFMFQFFGTVTPEEISGTEIKSGYLTVRPLAAVVGLGVG
jgi:hypothetical protein